LALSLWWQGSFSAEAALSLRVGLLLTLVAAGSAVYFALTWTTGVFRPGTIKRALRRTG
jgi:hypothetical protein